MQLSEFDFALPEKLIAQHPLADRSASRLLQYDRKKAALTHGKFADLLELLGANNVLVLNESRVLPARILWENKEIFLAEPLPQTKENSGNAQTVHWKCLVRPGKFFQVGRELQFPDGTTAEVVEIFPDGLREVLFRSANFERFLEKFGQVPLPPYIHEKLADPERYQTVYARETGSVAAPTAGLHFTPELLEKLKNKGVQIEYLTLHVGLGTFLSVKTENIAEHQMHAEFFSIAPAVMVRLNAAKKAGKRITAVGTTSLRTLESSAKNSQNELKIASGKTDLFLYPPAPFHFVDQLLTNFHLPKSTLLMLVSAFLDPDGMRGIQKMHELYQAAIAEKYRFFSFGDAMLIT